MPGVATQTTGQGGSVSGTFTLLNAHESFGEGRPPVASATVEFGGISIGLSPAWWDAENNLYVCMAPLLTFPTGSLPNEQYEEGKRPFVAWYSLAGDTEEYAVWGYTVVARLYAGVDPIPWTVSANYYISITGERIYRSRSASPGGSRSAAPVYACETSVEDVWLLDRPATAFVNCGGASAQVIQVWSDRYENWEPFITQGEQVMLGCNTFGGIAGTEYASISLTWSNVDVDFSHRYSDRTQWYLHGYQNTVMFRAMQTHTATLTNNVFYGRPLILDFSNFTVRDRTGNIVNVRIQGPFRASKRVPQSLTWSTEP